MEHSEILDLKKILEDAAKIEQEREKIGGQIQYISLRNKKFSIGDTTLGDTINVAVVATAFEKAYYDKPYVRGETQPPACFAVSITGENMVRHEDSPNKQYMNCTECALAQWDSAPVGKGKACKDGRRLICLGVNSNGDVDHSQIAILKLSPTSLANWAKYAKTTALTRSLPTWAVITQFKFDDNESYPKLVPAFAGLLSSDDVGKIHTRQKEFEDIALMPYNVEKYIHEEAAPKSKMS